MPIHGKKYTTSHSADSTQGQSAPALPDQDEFRQHLRELARGAIRVVLEDVMREELNALIGVGWGESSPKRRRQDADPTFPLHTNRDGVMVNL